MPLMEIIGKIFGTDPSGATKATELAWLQKLEMEEKTERDKSQRLLDWYNQDRVEILKHIEEAAKKTFAVQELLEWQYPLINGVARTIKRLSLSYKESPSRTLINLESGDELDKDAPEYEIYERMFQGLDMDKKFKEMDRMATLFNTLHVEAVPRNEAIDWDLRLRPTSFVVPDPMDAFQPLRFAYEWVPQNPDDLMTRPGWVLWSEDQHVFITKGGQEHGLSMDDGKNPYDGKLPLVVIRKQEQDDYWGIYGADLVDGFEQVAIQLGNMWENMFMQTHGQPMGLNLGLPEGSTLRTGPKNPILVEGVGKDKHPPSLTFVKADADIKEVFDALDWFIKELGATRGLPPSAWAHEQKDLSGFAKLVDNLELLEAREEELPMWIQIEEDLFTASKMVWNRWVESIEGAQAMPEEVGLKVIFPEISFPESPTEESTRIAMDIKNGLTSVAHEIARKDKISLDDAIKKAKEIAEIQKDIKGSTFTMPPLPPIPPVPGAAQAGQGEGEGSEEAEGENQ